MVDLLDITKVNVYFLHAGDHVITCTVEPLNKGHLGTQAAVPYSEVVPYWEVRDKTVIL